MTGTLKKDLEGDYKLLLSWRYNNIEFLGLPSLKDNRPLTLEEIYIPLSFTWEQSGDKRVYLPEALEKSRHLVVLGDPGCGKSTLVKVITYSFGRAEPTPLSQRFGPLLPVPIILRDYRIGTWQSKEDMLRDFIRQLDEDIRNRVSVEWLLAALREGRGFLLLDGLDEVGSREDRIHLRDKIVTPLLDEMPESYAILTSRIVGFEEAPLEGNPIINVYWRDNEVVSQTTVLRWCYVAPFDDEDIEQFIRCWYAAREPDPELRRAGLRSLGQALQQSDRIKRLATNPSLLTLMALIHRVTAHLPSGRVKLYDKIVEAYLETIQTYRKLGQYPASLDQMKRWLAKVGWEMQSRRTDDQQSELQIHRGEVLDWLAEAIAKERPGAEEEARDFLEYVARRSGLLIPRGPDLFSFVHLTFQEYFAAFYLRGQLGRFDQLSETCSVLVGKRFWHEVLSLLFEMLAEFPGAGDELLETLEKRVQTRDKEGWATAELFSTLLLDDQSGLSLRRQEEAAAFALSIASHLFNWVVIDRLKQLGPKRLSRLVDRWLEAKLESGDAESIGEDFIIVGSELRKDWGALLGDFLSRPGGLQLNAEQMERIVQIVGENSEVSRRAAELLPLSRWLTPRPFPWALIHPRLAEFGLAGMLKTPQPSPRVELVIQSSLALAISGSLVIREVVMACGMNRTERVLNRVLDRLLYYDTNATLNESRERDLALVRRYWHPDRAGSQARVQARVLASIMGSALSLVANGKVSLEAALDTGLELASYLASAVSSPPPAASESQREFATLGDAEWLFFSPGFRSNQFEVTEGHLREMADAHDDWTRLLALSAFLLLGRGTLEYCTARNELLRKGIYHSETFSFPKRLRPETDAAAFRRELPVVLRLAFLHDPDDPWLIPEKFDRSTPESRFFLSTPREFYALAAEALDPQGKTALAQWRETERR
jgi:internalin A